MMIDSFEQVDEKLGLKEDVLSQTGTLVIVTNGANSVQIGEKTLCILRRNSTGNDGITSSWQ